MSHFASRLIAWQRQHGRHDLPWQGADAYGVWLSEIMLQQTQVATVIPYYQRFIATFPTLATLAAATEEQVLTLWSGLGYYARGRNLHRTAQRIMAAHHGKFPRVFEDIIALPGIGRSTAAAICALAYHEQRAILDGNVKRVLARYCGIAGWTGDAKVTAQLWQQAEALLPQNPAPPTQAKIQPFNNAVPSKPTRSDIAIYTQALMDMGATICTRSKPRCGECPLSADCVAYQTHRVADFPAPRPRKIVPEKQITWLLLRYDDAILLEKRPPTGIWGGLWSFPQLEADAERPLDYAQRQGWRVLTKTDLSEFTHTFTHFKLHIRPVLLHVAEPAQQAAQTKEIWLPVAQAEQLAIPSPVRSLLRKLTQKMDGR